MSSEIFVNQEQSPPEKLTVKVLGRLGLNKTAEEREKAREELAKARREFNAAAGIMSPEESRRLSMLRSNGLVETGYDPYTGESQVTVQKGAGELSPPQEQVIMARHDADVRLGRR